MKVSKLPLSLISLLVLTGCVSPTPSESSSSSSTEPVTSDVSSESSSESTFTSTSEELEGLEIANISLMGVYSSNNAIRIVNKLEGETFTYSFEGDAIRIEDDKVISLRAGSETAINVTSNLGRTGSFTARVINRAYSSTHASTEASEGWFNEVSIDKVDNMTSRFVNGMDISSMKQLYDNGQKFYDKNGVETALPLILKDSGVNYIRLRLWVEPYDTWVENGETKTFAYGGGNCYLDNVLWMAKECKCAGLKVLLNFHYSDFWTDPTKQIIPKAWKDITSVSELANKVYEYTKNSLLAMQENGCLPDSVALGNEIYSGLFVHNPGDGITKEVTGGEPLYSTDRSYRTNGTQGTFDHTTSRTSTGNSNLRTYLSAGLRAVNEVSSNILTMVHYVKGFADPDNSITFFNMIDDLGFDIYGLSAYSYYHFGNISTLRTGLSKIANAFPNKKIAITETSYGFTFETDSLASNSFSASSLVSGYGANVQDQAKMIRDTSEVVANIANGWGVFYWEGAWTPTKKSGWADAASKVSWANQALVSYNGKALASLEVYNKMLGK